MLIREAFMEKRRLGRTGHSSSVITFGSAALWNISQAEADAAIELALEHGVNHFDVAPMYGKAERLLGPWMEKHHKEIFLACKTNYRSKSKAWESIKRSLELLRVDHFDLFQFHRVNDLETLNVILGHGGALEAVLEAKEKGLVRHIGITGHRPFVQVEGLNRFDFETILFPINRVLAANANDYTDFSLLLELAREKDVGTIGIKAIAKRPWAAIAHKYATWYEPFEEQTEIDKSLWYALSQGITTAALPADLRLWPMVIDAAERASALDLKTQEQFVAEVKDYKPIFPNE
jgi:aryl-alcohol dehydrogenase-like predicted oxidoreductase